LPQVFVRLRARLGAHFLDHCEQVQQVRSLLKLRTVPQSFSPDKVGSGEPSHQERVSLNATLLLACPCSVHTSGPEHTTKELVDFSLDLRNAAASQAHRIDLRAQQAQLL
jgi:hypothetical protein